MSIPKTRISDEQFVKMVANAKILESDTYGPKVFLLEDGRFIKVFRRKRLVSSALLVPYSQRFIDNAEALKRKNIATLTPLQHYLLPDSRFRAVHYDPLQGKTLRGVSAETGFNWQSRIEQLAQFIRLLHDKGVYFRSLHLGNIVECATGGLGLIDISDMRIYRRALPDSLRRRNLLHFSSYLQRENLLDTFPFAELQSRVIRDSAAIKS